MTLRTFYAMKVHLVHLLSRLVEIQNSTTFVHIPCKVSTFYLYLFGRDHFLVTKYGRIAYHIHDHNIS